MVYDNFLSSTVMENKNIFNGAIFNWRIEVGVTGIDTIKFCLAGEADSFDEGDADSHAGETSGSFTDAPLIYFIDINFLCKNLPVNKWEKFRGALSALFRKTENDFTIFKER